MGFGLYRKIAASGARLGCLSWFGVNRAAHRWRAVVLPGNVEVLQFACSEGVAPDPRPRAASDEGKTGSLGRAELAGGRTDKVLAELPARQKEACRTLAAPSRELSARCRLAARSRAGWREVEPSGRWRGQIRGFGIFASRVEGNRRRAMHSSRPRVPLFAQTSFRAAAA